VSAPLVPDHLVYAVPDLAVATAELHTKLGVAPTAGGRHEGVGTHNAILALGARVAWKLSLRPLPYGDGLVPFVIDWGQATHPAEAGGACSLASFRALQP
jgi:hypothetical protein